MFKPNDEVLYKGRECTIKEANFLGAIVVFDDDSGREFIPANRLDTELMMITEPVIIKQAENKLSSAPKKRHKHNFKHENLFGKTRLSNFTKHQYRSIMNTTLVQQTFAAITNATIADIKDWRKFLEDAGEKLTARTNELVDKQKQALDTILGLQKDITSVVPKVIITAAKQHKDFLKREVVMSVCDQLLVDNESISIEEVYDALVLAHSYTGSKKQLYQHMRNLEKAGMLASVRDTNSKFNFPSNLYSKPNRK